jgi:hypothetical protein
LRVLARVSLQEAHLFLAAETLLLEVEWLNLLLHCLIFQRRERKYRVLSFNLHLV